MKKCIRDESSKKLRDLQNKWQHYRHDFASTHFQIETQNNLLTINWDEFNRKFKRYLESSLQCCKDYIASYRPDESKDFFRLTMEHQRYSIEGSLAFLGGKIKQAIELYLKAIKISPGYLTTWLFLASAHYNLKEYYEVINVVTSYSEYNTLSWSCNASSPEENFFKINNLHLPLNNFSGNPCKQGFLFYGNFSLLDDNCIEENYLQLTHSIYTNTEMLNYLAKAKLAIDKNDITTMAEVYYRRGVECAQVGMHFQAVDNFEKSQKFNWTHRDYYYSKSLFIIEKIDEAIEIIKKVIANAKNRAAKFICLNTLVDYYFQCEDQSQADTFIDQLIELEKKEKNVISILQLYYSKAKLKSFLKKPAFSSFKPVTEKFFEFYMKSSSEEQDNKGIKWLLRYVDLIDELCEKCIIQEKSTLFDRGI